ncbi:MAG TPA: hypothetical protein PKC21_07095 [Oligoflexia bacterium]|nr:hypothetical protein [Oligoflexia bacterium]HMR25103.1 hypothetical protein [Oligoflexia bacterium]
MRKYFILSICLVVIAVSAQKIVFQVSKAPEKLTAISPQWLDLDVAAEQWLNVIKNITAQMSLGIPIDEPTLDPDILLADGLLAEEVGYCYRNHYADEDQFNYDYDNDVFKKETDYTQCRTEWYPQFDTRGLAYWYDNPDNQAPAVHDFMHKVYASETLRNVAYAWLAPVFVDLFADVNGERKVIMCRIIEHGFHYTNTLIDSPENLSCELSYLEAEKRRAFDDSEYYAKFHWRRPNSECNAPKKWDENEQPFRKLEAWVIRRHIMQHMTLEEMRNWFYKIKTELLVCEA